MGSISFSHVGFHVRDIAAMERFYTGLLGLTVTDRGPLDTPLGRLPFVFTSSTPLEHHQVVARAGRMEAALGQGETHAPVNGFRLVHPLANGDDGVVERASGDRRHARILL